MPTNITYKGSILTTVNNNQAKVLKTSGKYLEDDVTISSVINLQGKTTSITPNTSTQITTISPDGGYEGLSGVTITVNPIPSSYIIPAGTITITTNGTHDVSQYADANVSITVDTAELPTPTISINSDNGLITSTVTLSSGGYIDASEKTATLQLETQGPTAVRPIEAVTTVYVKGKYMTGNIGIYGITPTYVGSSITRNTELIVDGQTVTAPSGYYANTITVNVQGESATLLSPINFTSGPSPTVTVDSSGLVTAIVNQARGDGYRVVTNSGYISSTNAFVSITAPARTTTYQLDTQAATTVVPSESTTTITGQKYMTGDVTVAAITPTYVGSGVTTNPSITVSGPTVTVPSGYYDSQQTETIANATRSPTTSFSVAPGQISVDNTGLISTAVTITNATTTKSHALSGYVDANGESGQFRYKIGVSSATYQLPTLPAQSFTPSSSTQTVASTGKYMLGDITVQPIPSEYVIPTGVTTITTNGTHSVSGYASASVSVQPNLEAKSFTPSETSTTITAGSGYDGLSSVTVAGITSTYVGSSVPRRTNFSTTITDSTYTITAEKGYYNSSLSMNIHVQGATTIIPSESVQNAVSAGRYVNGAINVAAITSTYVGSSVPTQSATTVTPSSTTQTLNVTGKYMTGNVTVNPIPSQYIVPSGTLTITSVDTTTTFDATSYASVAVNLNDADSTAY